MAVPEPEPDPNVFDYDRRLDRRPSAVSGTAVIDGAPCVVLSGTREQKFTVGKEVYRVVNTGFAEHFARGQSHFRRTKIGTVPHIPWPVLR